MDAAKLKDHLESPLYSPEIYYIRTLYISRIICGRTFRTLTDESTKRRDFLVRAADCSREF